MAKEFDIYLNRRLTECDIIVYSIPYRDGLTVMERLILQTCLESYTLQKFIAAETGSELVSHIDKMIKTCHERLNHNITIDSTADFEVHYALNPIPSRVVFQEDVAQTLCNTFASAQNVLELYAAPVLAQTKKSFGSGHSEIQLDLELKEPLKRAIEQVHSQVELATQLNGIDKRGIISASVGIEVDSVLTDLLYRVYTTASEAISIAANSVETEIHFSLGRGSSNLEVASYLIGEQIEKRESVVTCLDILSDLSELLLLCMQPTTNFIEFAGSVNAITKRYRLLAEMDSDKLTQYDDMTLEDVDYVILQS